MQTSMRRVAGFAALLLLAAAPAAQAQYLQPAVAMPRDTMLMTSVSASTAQIELTFSGVFEVFESGPISSTATPR